MPRIGKVRIYSEEGKLIREGAPREHDFTPKILGLFSSAELIKGLIITVTVIFGAGVLWAKMDGMASTQEKMWSTISGYQNKIGCIQNQIAKCCKDAVYCS